MEMVDNRRTAPHAPASKSLLMSLFKVLPSESTTQGASHNCWRDVKNTEESQTPCLYLPYLTDNIGFDRLKMGQRIIVSMWTHFY